MTEEQMGKLLSEGDDYLIVTHMNPDGDTLGSAAALCRGLRKAGKRAGILQDENVPQRYETVCRGLLTEEIPGKKPIFVDVAAPDMMCRKAKEAGLTPFAVIDHHRYGWPEIKNALVDSGAAAVGEMVFRLLEIMGISSDAEIAKALYIAVSTDTGCFRYGNTTAETHRITAGLLQYPIGLEALNRELFEIRSPAAVALEREVLCGLRYEAEGRIALIAVSRRLRRELGVTEDDMEHISAIPRTVSGVDVGITLKELPDETGWRVSVRTTPLADAGAICEKFGGGGHARAAGCTIMGDLQSVTKAILATAKQML